MKPEYEVVADHEHPPCVACNQGGMWTIIGFGGIGIGESWGDKQLADDICELMNYAFSEGKDQK